MKIPKKIKRYCKKCKKHSSHIVSIVKGKDRGPLKRGSIAIELLKQEPLESTIDITAPAEADYDNLDLMWFGSSQPNASDDEFSCSREIQ